MSSECVCHTNKWCFYCEMYVPLERTLADRDAEIAILKELISGNKGVEELYKLQQLVQEQGQEIKRLRTVLAALPDRAMQVDSFADCGDVPAFPLDDPTAESQEEWFEAYCKAQREHIEGLIEDALSHQTEQPSQHVELRPPLRWFAEQMEVTLRTNDHKGGWDSESFSYLYSRLYEEWHEIWRAYNRPNGKRDWEEIIKECADVANMAMMIADNARGQAALKGEDSNA